MTSRCAAPTEASRLLECPVFRTRGDKRATLAWMSELARCVAISLCLYGVVVNSVRYREDGHRDG